MIYNVNTLQAAIAETEKGLDGEAGADRAYEVVVALGRLRVSSTIIPDDVKFLSLDVALAATRHMRWVTSKLINLVRELLDHNKDWGFEEEDSTMSILLTRHNLWCAEFAITEIDNALLQASKASTKLTDELVLTITDLAQLDTVMITNTDLFGAARELPLLENLRKVTLTQPLPWWLDGTIEADGKRNMEKFDAWLRQIHQKTMPR